jgi:hypothetical protein
MYQEMPNPADCDRKLASALAVFEDPDGITVPLGATSLQFLQAIYRSAEQPMMRRMKAAMAALPYEHPKLAVTVALDGHDSWGAKLQGAIARSRPVLELHAAEAAPVASNGHDAAAVSAAAMRMPMVSYRRR